MTAPTLRAFPQDAKYPVAFLASGGERRVLPDRRPIFFPPTFPETVIRCPWRRGIIMLDLDKPEGVEAGVADEAARVGNKPEEFTRRPRAEQGDAPQETNS